MMFAQVFQPVIFQSQSSSMEFDVQDGERGKRGPPGVEAELVDNVTDETDETDEDEMNSTNTCRPYRFTLNLMKLYDRPSKALFLGPFFRGFTIVKQVLNSHENLSYLGFNSKLPSTTRMQFFPSNQRSDT